MNVSRRIWQPLDSSKQEIRIFALDPNPDLEARPSGKLLVCSIQEQPQYEAISYAWGAAGHVKSIELDGCAHYVTDTLHACLRHLRKADEARFLWCDAISINQFDQAEKSQQIQLMQDIYAGASTVHAWLGYKSDALDRGFDMINRVHHSDAGGAGGEGEGEGEGDPFPSDDQPMDHALLAETVKFGAATWHDRLWVVQEAALAHTLTFRHGHREIQYDALAPFMDRLHRIFMREDLATLPEELVGEMQRCWARINEVFKLRDLGLTDGASRRRLHKPAEFLLEIIGASRKRAVQDPRDRVFGLLALVDKAFGNTTTTTTTGLIRPDYALSLAETYTAFAHAYVREARSLSLLHQASRRLNAAPDLPSWVPDWTSPYDFDIESSRYMLAGLRYHASGHPNPECALARPFPRVLALVGARVDTIQHVGPPQEERVRHIGGVRWACLAAWKALFLRVTTPEREWGAAYNPFATLQQAFWRTMMADVVHVRGMTTIRRLSTEFLDALVPQMEELLVGTRAEADTDVQMKNHVNMVALATERRRFFVSAAGRPGLGAPDAEVGDEIWIVTGARLPFVLRPAGVTSDGRETHTFVSEAYVHGMMSGEQVKPEKGLVFGPVLLE